MPFNGQIFLADDEYTTIVKILPFLLKFSIQCLENNSYCNKEIIVVSAIRNIQFILETQGCSLDSAMIVILKSIFKNYPDKIKQEKLQKIERENRKKNNNNVILSQQQATSRSGQGGFSNRLLNQAIHGTGSAEQLPFQDNMGRFQLNQNSEREGLNFEQLKIDTKNASQKLSMIESLFSYSWITQRDEPSFKKEPNSGFEKTLSNLFNMLLETYVSVLSSISSHILHQIFYDVILPCLTSQPFEEDRARLELMEKEERTIHFEFCNEVKIFAVKIAEKIITICQGDLIVSRTLLDILVKSQSNPSFKK